MHPKVSAVIPAHNSAKRIGILLNALAAQTVSHGFFEVIVVDNASTDGTSDVVRSHQAVTKMAEQGIICRTVREEKLGLIHARIRGVQEACAEFICFLDDDTTPLQDYIGQGAKTISEDGVGLLVSRVFPEYESAPTKSVLKREHLLAINNKLGDAVIVWGPENIIAPTLGAGMWVRRSAFLNAIPWDNPDSLLSDRKGKSLTSGGDIEIGILMGRSGYKRVYDPKLKILHRIPSSRLCVPYLCNLIVGIIRSQLTLEIRYRRLSNSHMDKILAWFKVIAAVLAFPFLLARKDGFRDAIFIIASRWASTRGSY